MFGIRDYLELFQARLDIVAEFLKDRILSPLDRIVQAVTF